MNNTHDAAALALWALVESAGRAMVTDTGPYAWGEDDAGMIDATADDLLAWADDCSDRMGASEGDFRAALLSFIAYRDDAAGLDDETHAAALLEAFDAVDSDDARALIRQRAEACADTAHAHAGRDGGRIAWATAETWADAVDRMGGAA